MLNIYDNFTLFLHLYFIGNSVLEFINSNGLCYSEQCFKETILQRNYKKMTIE